MTNTRALLAQICEELGVFDPNEVLLRVCCACEKQFGQIPIPPGYGKSHGYCTRHYREFWNADIKTDIPDLAALTPEQRKDWMLATTPYVAPTKEPDEPVDDWVGAVA